MISEIPLKGFKVLAIFRILFQNYLESVLCFKFISADVKNPAYVFET
jgi:hypothetical protein